MARKKTRKLRDKYDRAAARELEVYAENDYPTYEHMQRNIYPNACRKVKRGTYNSKAAVRLFQYGADEAAKHYAGEFGSGSSKQGYLGGQRVRMGTLTQAAQVGMNKATRMVVARRMERYFWQNRDDICGG